MDTSMGPAGITGIDSAFIHAQGTNGPQRRNEHATGYT